jgi:DNA-binding GntR family transcriptional regulator
MEALAITSVTETIVHHLRVHIIGRQLPPGHKLNEIELSSSLGVSRPPLREAFRILENEHLITSTPRKGAYVNEMSIDECREIFEAREMIECYAIELLKAKGIRELPEASKALAVARRLHMPRTSDPYEKFGYLKAIADFHISLVKASGNSRLSHFYRAIFSNLARYQDMYVFIPGLMEKSQGVHEQILGFIQKGNYEKAKEKLRSHIRGYFRTTEEKLRNSQDYNKVGSEGDS